MNISDLSNNINSKNWTLTDNFTIQIDNDIQGNRITQEDWNISTISVSLPELSAGESEAILGGEYRLNSKIQDLFRFTITFRDYDQLKIRSYFENKFILQQLEYPDAISTNIRIDYVEDYGKSEGIKIFETSALITNISGTTFNNSESNIQEFTVSFSSTSYNNHIFNGFGSSQFSNTYVDGMKRN